jgi:chemotaxis protein CheC
MGYEKFEADHLDALKELGNIGAGNAITALSSFLNTEINMEVVEAKLATFNEAANIFGNPETEVAAVYISISGDLKGYVLYLWPVHSAKAIAGMLMGMNPEELEFDEMTMSAISEIGNIMSGSYITALSSFTGMTFDISPPAVAVDMNGALLDGIISLTAVGNRVLIIQTSMVAYGVKIAGVLSVLFEPDSLLKLLDAIGMGV